MAWVCDRPAVAIRRHRLLQVTLEDLVRLGAIDQGLHEFLAAAVRARQQIIVAGATGAGKTTMLRALAAEIPADERIVTIETELELGLDRFPELHPDVVALEARDANVEGVGEVTAAELVRMSLRMNPDRVIVGEVRGDEIIPMLNAMSQGNDGSMCTLHADSSATVFNKLALYAMQAPERLSLEATNQLAAAAIDLVVFIAKTDTAASSRRYARSSAPTAGKSSRTSCSRRDRTDEPFRPSHSPTNWRNSSPRRLRPGLARTPRRLVVMSFPWIMCGLALGAGILLVVSGIQHRPIRPAAQPSLSIQKLPPDAAKRGVQAAVCAILVLALTGWPVAALAAAMFGWCAPELLGGSRAVRPAWHAPRR